MWLTLLRGVCVCVYCVRAGALAGMQGVRTICVVWPPSVEASPLHCVCQILAPRSYLSCRCVASQLYFHDAIVLLYVHASWLALLKGTRGWDSSPGHRRLRSPGVIVPSRLNEAKYG